MNISNLWKYDLRKGSTDNPRNGACLFDAGMWLVYGKIGDNPPCSCPIIRAYAIGLNDRMPDDKRQLLKPFILRVVGNRNPAAEAARLRFIVLETARRIVGLSLPDDASYAVIERVCRAVEMRASGSAAAASGSAAEAAREAAAAASAPTSAETAREATEAAWAASVAAEQNWPAAITVLDGVLKIGRQSPEMNETLVRKAVSAFELARHD